MAELNQEASSASKSKKIRSRKQSSRVDLTAMVDLAFLLITFFMLTTTLSKPKAMDLSMPDREGQPIKVDPNRTMTILIGEHNKAQCFMGKFDDATPKEIILGTNKLRKELADRKKQVLDYSTAKGKPEQGLIVLIKAGKKSNYGNLVDVLDEIAIVEIASYAIVAIEQNETAFLEKR